MLSNCAAEDAVFWINQPNLDMVIKKHLPIFFQESTCLAMWLLPLSQNCSKAKIRSTLLIFSVLFISCIIKQPEGSNCKWLEKAPGADEVISAKYVFCSNSQAWHSPTALAEFPMPGYSLKSPSIDTYKATNHFGTNHFSFGKLVKAILGSISCLFIRGTGISVPLLMQLQLVHCRKRNRGAQINYSVKNARLLVRP